jgi:GNAT superfamily N-acetyltransferase
MQSVGLLRANPVVSPVTLKALPPATREGTRKDARRLGRRAVYLGEGFSVRLQRDGVDVGGELVDLSPDGFGIALLDLGRGALPELGDVVTIEHTGRSTKGLSHRGRVTSVTDGVFAGRRLPRIGVALITERTTRSARDRRAAERYECSSSLPASAAAASPIFFREWLHFSLCELGAGGMTASTSLRNKGLLPGMELAFRVTLPMVGMLEVRGRISSIGRDTTDGAFRVGVQWVDPSRELLQAIAEYLLLGHKELTPAKLRKGGLPVGSVERAVSYDYARSDEDFEEILALRLRSHQEEGRLEGVGIDDMKSSFDAHSRHLVCRFGESIVGYVRVIYVDGDPAKSQYVSAGGHEVPEWLWKAGFVEAGAGATDPEFQRAGLFVPLMQHAARVALQSGSRYMLGACDDELLGMYQQMGFVLVETRMVEPKPGWSFRSHLILLDLQDLPEEGKFIDAMEAVAEFVGAA